MSLISSLSSPSWGLLELAIVHTFTSPERLVTSMCCGSLGLLGSQSIAQGVSSPSVMIRSIVNDSCWVLQTPPSSSFFEIDPTRLRLADACNSRM